MRVAVLCKRFGGLGGQEQVVRALVRHLVDRGHEVVVITTDGEPLDGARLRVVPYRGGFPRAGRPWRIGKALAAALAQEAHDVSFGEQKLWGCNVLRPGGGVEVAYHDWREAEARRRWGPLGRARRLAPKAFFDRRCEGKGLRDPALRRVVVNAGLVKDQLLAAYPHLAGRVEVVRNGVDLQRFRPPADDADRRAVASELGWTGDAPTAVFASHDFERKGLRQALEVLHGARRASPRLVVLGGDRAGPYRRLARTLGVADRVGFVGETTTPERYYRAADVLLLPTHYDPCANVTIEALACGLPVITTAQNGAHELLTEGEDGYVASSPDDVDGMAAALAGFAAPDVLARGRRAARETACRHPLREKLERLEAVLEAAAAAGP